MESLKYFQEKKDQILNAYVMMSICVHKITRGKNK